ncbi:MAG TPA: hypothetical protein PKZ19_13825 [Zoogloea sp.]|nr:hypothetical protein [Zoogloea sp.]
MRKTLFVIFILLGSAVGVFAALNESVGLKILLGNIGAVAGAAIGGALSGIGRRRGWPSLSEILCVRHTIPSKELHAPQDQQGRTSRQVGTAANFNPTA